MMRQHSCTASGARALVGAALSAFAPRSESTQPELGQTASLTIYAVVVISVGHTVPHDPGGPGRSVAMGVIRPLPCGLPCEGISSTWCHGIRRWAATSTADDRHHQHDQARWASGDPWRMPRSAGAVLGRGGSGTSSFQAGRAANPGSRPGLPRSRGAATRNPG